MEKIFRAKKYWSVGLSLLWVLFMWGFWSRGIFALGINAFGYMALLLAFFVLVLRTEGHYQTRDLAWIVPLAMIALGFALYENPFFKGVSLLVFPVMGALLYCYAWADNKRHAMWRFTFFTDIAERIFSFFGMIGTAIQQLSSFFHFQDTGRKAFAKRVLTGGVALILALLIILPLLSSADAAFASKLGGLYDVIKQIISASIIAKIAVFLVLSVGTLTAVSAWGRSYEIAESAEARTYDSLVAGIVLVGVLLFYLLFLWVQLGRLWVGALPFDFKETETLVKSGFWQLLALSLINLAVFFFLYRKTHAGVQRILGLFTVASLLLLASSAHRMWLYVTYYGFSYEKFYASYAVLFCGVLFIWLLSRLFVARQANVMKVVTFLFLWMFALVALAPVEQFIVRRNVALVHHPNSQIRLFEMTMLSPDVLALIKHYRDDGTLQEPIGYLSRESGRNPEEAFDWVPWITRQEQRIADKQWYECTLACTF